LRNANGTVIAKDNFPAQGFCMDVSTTYFTGRQAVARYSAPAITGIDSDAFVDAKCIEVPTFKGIDTL
jgi:hypothetical protein